MKMSNFNFSQSDQVWLSVKTDRRPFTSLGQSDMNSLKAIMKETAENCDVDALMQVINSYLTTFAASEENNCFIVLAIAQFRYFKIQRKTIDVRVLGSGE